MSLTRTANSSTPQCSGSSRTRTCETYRWDIYSVLQLPLCDTPFFFCRSTRTRTWNRSLEGYCYIPLTMDPFFSVCQRTPCLDWLPKDNVSLRGIHDIFLIFFRIVIVIYRLKTKFSRNFNIFLMFLQKNPSMDPDPDSEKQSSNNKSHTSNLLQSLGIRCSICSCDNMDQFISRYRYNLLFHLGLLFWIVLPSEEETDSKKLDI